MRYGQITWEREQSARWLSWGIRFFLTAALTASQTPGEHAPFALGFLAAAGPGAEGMAALLGAGAGAVLFLEFEDALAFLATAVLIYTSAVALRGTRLPDRPWFRPLTGAGLFFAVRMIYITQALSPLDQVAPCVAAAVLV
ncbi:MAG: stage II sporulation protein E, partial [Oscillibacter sp.]|nr:stage II sporulation protein E [Oscillibacter sp.]